jgi:ABC-type transport system involved in multi-copper enzyme maturation permease subunit
MPLEPSDLLPVQIVVMVQAIPESQAIILRNLRKVFGNTVAVDDISLQIFRGEIFGFMVLAIPFIMERPPKELVKFLADWLGAEDFQRKLVLFVWVDASMNKLAVILGTVLAGGIIVDEKSRGTLDLLLSNSQECSER